MFDDEELWEIVRNLAISLVVLGLSVGLAIGFACLAICMDVT